ncbi:MAG TPA: protein-glutamate O-methyltransferase CheR [Bryobacteraceae bacterium]|jgi:chemotaxis protein methyltransferase CheR|nr:protein-glutamate O-methyltransferase CheR [Bryobacteraceae bacterium]
MSPPQDHISYLQQHVYAGSGIVLDTEKQYLLEARLAPILRERGLASLLELSQVLRSTQPSPLHAQVVEAMTTNETYFFREPAHYDALRQAILPELLEMRAGTRKLTCWSAAASTGQEAYSLAMLLLEMGLGGWSIDILGTDLSSRVLKQAESGRYSQLEVNRGLPVTLLLKYFRRAGLDWELKEEVRRMVRFRAFDLRSGMRSLGPFDVVFCRNVLIYFDSATKRRILDEIHGSLFRGGYLVVGTTEAGLPAGDRFERHAIGNAVVYVAN